VAETIKTIVGVGHATVYRAVEGKRKELGIGYRPRGLSKRAV